MSADPESGSWRRYAKSAYGSLGALTRVGTRYLGLGVLVAGLLTALLPDVRQQMVRIQQAVLAEIYPLESESFANASVQTLGQNAPVAGGTQGLAALNHVSLPLEIMRELGVSIGQVDALRSYIARKYRVAYDATGGVVATSFRVAHEKELDPLLLLAVIAIESRYNPLAESSVGAQGLMQVMTRVHRDKLDPFGGPSQALNPVVNINVGSMILSDCIRRRGSVQGGLACYVGATGPSDGGYGARVLAERRRLALAAGIPLVR
ncbi:lytic transglycosylase domain-containing protein [Kerstersia similis]|uniref:lytic transglycosylase domain-containing protein n=1 Tax=Kerstersia similis TaxID=206505 RepID=UPI0039EE65D0